MLPYGADGCSSVERSNFDASDAHITRSPVVVDEHGWHALARELDNLSDRIAKIEAASRKRLSRADHVGEQEAAVVLMLCNSPTEVPEETAPSHHSPRRRAGARRARS